MERKSAADGQHQALHDIGISGEEAQDRAACPKHRTQIKK